MATRISGKGQITLPKKVRETLRLAAGDRVEFALNERGQFELRKAAATSMAARRRPARPRVAAQTRRRAAELHALLRDLD